MWVTPLHDVRSVFKLRDLMWVTPQKMNVAPCDVRTASKMFKLNTYPQQYFLFVTPQIIAIKCHGLFTCFIGQMQVYIQARTSFWVSWFHDRLFGAKRVYQFVTKTMTYIVLVTGKWPHMHPASFDYGKWPFR